jgi:hypothetical protein
MMASSAANQSQVAFERELDEWRRLIGRALLGFGDIEFLTVKCLAHIPSDRISRTSSRLRFSERVDLLVEIIEGRCLGSGPATELVTKLKATKALAEVRNLIAHNPILLNIYAHRATGDTVTELAISAARQPAKSIDLASLKEYAAAVEDCAAELYCLLGPALKQLKPEAT